MRSGGESMFTIDASVYISALNPEEEGSSASQVFLQHVSRGPVPVFSPTLLLVELYAAAARIWDTEQAQEMAQAVRGLPGQLWIPLDEAWAEESGHVAARHRLRGSDAVYAAVARRYGATLITLDRQQWERLRPAIPVQTPAEALNDLANSPSRGTESA
jgi:predicted nucleic acid-binding protein